MLLFSLFSSFHLLFLCFVFSSILLAKFVCFLYYKTILKSIDDGQEVDSHEEDVGFTTVECMDKEDWESVGDELQSSLYDEDLGFITFSCSKNGDLIADNISGGEVLQKGLCLKQSLRKEPSEQLVEEQASHCSPPSRHNIKEDKSTNYADLVTLSVNQLKCLTTPLIDTNEHSLVDNTDNSRGHINTEHDNLNMVKTFLEEDGNFIIFSPTKSKSKNVTSLEDHAAETFEEPFTLGSTSKSSSEWRTSLLNRNSSVSEYPFSSSSRRSCPTWESYSAFQKYDEEMIFYDQVSAQKLNETKLFENVKKVLPRSTSQKIVDKLRKRSKKSSEFRRNPFHELEAAYVAQICLAWEALSLNYKNFLLIRALQGEEDPGCPAYIAQQFQQFQVLLQRFIENEPYEYGRRPEVYARIRISSPKLLQVPEFRRTVKTENDEEEEWNTKISSAKFIAILEDGIRTFMNFLKADKGKHYHIFKALLKRNNRTTLVDPSLLHFLKKAYKKKKKKIKDISRVGKCLRKTMPREEDMEILMALVDLKVVSRVLKMSEIGEEQLHWCEEKMSKLRFWEGKLQRDPSPVFFPAHPLP
ncbi:Dna ligase [Thalictrum thalictroides]|uniref:Dna ligase n=1 Tax=Thalictrum thalictroides TaxID=46969 RepID=A0A7J6VES2_THATH|nr:Dna ligase [Thalictrum thalictroides]